MEFQNAIDYIETHLTETIDYSVLARKCFLSNYHFQRMFSMYFGMTVGEYIRKRRLSQAGQMLRNENAKVLDAAILYGYESADSFTKAFHTFHGFLPSEIQKGKGDLRLFSALTLPNIKKGEIVLHYRIEEKKSMILTGYKERFSGVPYGEEREKQEEQLFVSTRAKQWILRGARGSFFEAGTDLCVIVNVDDTGYDFYYAAELASYERENLYNPNVTGIYCMEEFGFEEILVPKQTYAVFSTGESKRPVDAYIALRKQIATEWESDKWQLKNAPELSVYYWYPKPKQNKRHIEIWLPVEEKME